MSGAIPPFTHVFLVCSGKTLLEVNQGKLASRQMCKFSCQHMQEYFGQLYSTVDLTLHPHNQTGAGLSNIPDYQTVLILNYVLR